MIFFRVLFSFHPHNYSIQNFKFPNEIINSGAKGGALLTDPNVSLILAWKYPLWLVNCTDSDDSNKIHLE
jgi:hypothetical protein